MKILVTGGAGYIGSHSVYELIKAKHEVVVLDNLSTGNKEAIHPEAKFVFGDQRDEALLEKVFTENKFDAVMHFSAKLIVPESVEQPIEYFENNVHGVAVLLAAMKKHNVKNIVFSSTAAVYGEPKRVPIMEDDSKEPINPYGQSKLACEWLIQGAQVAYGINAVIFRYFNVAGADVSGNIGLSGKGRQLTHLIPVILESHLGIRPKMTVFGTDYETKDGTCVRDYIHITDLAKAHVLGVEYAAKGNSNVFNLGSKNGFTVKEVLAATENLGHQVNYEFGPRRAGDPAQLIASNDRATSILGWKPEFTLEQMIESDLNWRKNKKF